MLLPPAHGAVKRAPRAIPAHRDDRPPPHVLRALGVAGVPTAATTDSRSTSGNTTRCMGRSYRPPPTFLTRHAGIRADPPASLSLRHPGRSKPLNNVAAGGVAICPCAARSHVSWRPRRQDWSVFRCISPLYICYLASARHHGDRTPPGEEGVRFTRYDCMEQDERCPIFTP
jgi:hypothetical protein